MYLSPAQNKQQFRHTAPLRSPRLLLRFIVFGMEIFMTHEFVAPRVQHTSSALFHLFSTKLIALLASFQQFSNDFTICFLMSFQFGTHANPLSLNCFYAGGKFEPVLIDNAYKVVMRLNIKSVSQSDFGSYRCVAKNSLGDTDGTIKLYSK